MRRLRSCSAEVQFRVRELFGRLLERFFADRLLRQRPVSPHTIASYRDTFRLSLKFAHARLRTPPARLSFEVTAPRRSQHAP
jgi:hypothetical protein